uniref:NR LBD domain-containing protein n=1 Tax=Panagrolaimus sp. ES5 TaxID=591445 RepID=A0AC34FYE7_9BILA
MQTLNLRQSSFNTGDNSFDLLPHSSNLGTPPRTSSTSIFRQIRYAASAPEIIINTEIKRDESSKNKNEKFENYAFSDFEEKNEGENNDEEAEAENENEIEEEEEDMEDEDDEDEEMMIPAAAETTNSCLLFHSTPNKNLIHELIDVDRLELLINLRGLQIRGGPPNSDETAAASLRLSRIGDEIVEQLVEWTKVLPFYNELPVEVHTHLLTQRWSELVLLSACFYAVCTQCNRAEDVEVEQPSFENANSNLILFQRRLSAVMNKQIPFEHVSKEAGLLVEKLTVLLNTFSKLNITLEAYVCLKAITLVHYGNPPNDDPKTSHFHKIYSKKVQIIQDQFVKALQIHLSQCENGPRLTDLFNFLPLLSSTAAILLKSKMFYVPFLICREPDRFIDSSCSENELSSSRKDLQQQQQNPIKTTSTSTSSPTQSQPFVAANSTSSSISDVVEMDI